MSLLDELNPAQQAAAGHIQGPGLIIAGPGSGKTRVLTHRIANLMEHGVDPFNILALTFTNKASKEMRNRIEKIAGTEARSLYMGTFHSVFARLLRHEGQRMGYPADFTIYDTEDSRSLIRAIVKENKLDDKIYKANVVHNRISSAKNNLLNPEQYLADPELMSEDQQAKRPFLGKIYKAYAERCFRSGAMDFDDLLFKMHELISRFPEVLYKYQHQFQFIMVDEFQDTNIAQYSIIKKIADVHHNIVVVGDDAQSIYAFRGATIANILNFERDFPDMKTFKLEQNYRSTKNIVAAANKLIANNRNQLEKTIWTDKDEGEKIRVFKAATDNEEGRIIADAIFEIKMRDQLANNDFAILYRTNAQSRAFEESLRRHNIAYTIYGGLSFYQRKEVKDLLGYLKLTVNHNEEESLKRVINYPTRGIGKTSLEKMMVLASQHGKRLWEVMENINSMGFNTRTTTGVSAFVMMIKSYATLLQEKNAYEVATHIARSTGLAKELGADRTPEGISRMENIQELLNSIKDFVDNDEVVAGEEANADRSLGAYLQNITLLTDADREDPNADTIKLMTTHAAKGLEFPVVFVVGMEENLFPSQMAMYDRDDLEEERRLFYVAVTRAESRLYLSYATSRYRYGTLQYCEPSRFLSELPREVMSILGEVNKTKSREKEGRSMVQRPVNLVRRKVSASVDENFEASDSNDIQIGMQVAHNRFGNGKVVSIEGQGNSRLATIQFTEIGAKKIMLKFAKLKILNSNSMN